LETAQAESNAKLTEKAHEMEELFKKVEELEEENFTMKGQVYKKYLSVFHRQKHCVETF
jgi:tRNA splicing endonuclease